MKCLSEIEKKKKKNRKVSATYASSLQFIVILQKDGC